MGDVALTVAAALAGYLVGTFPTARLVTRVVTRGTIDIRVVGSGNPGGLNTLRAVGRTSGVVVILIDMVKGVTAGFLGWWIAGPAGAYAGATAAVVGHVLPVWSRFRGGKGIATIGGAELATFPIFFPIHVVIAGLLAVTTREPDRVVALGGPVWVVGALVWWRADLPNWWGPRPSVGLPISAVCCGLLVTVKFRVARRAARRA